MPDRCFKASPPETQFALSVARLGALLKQKTESALSTYGLTYLAFEVLVALDAQSEQQGLTPTELQELLFRSSGGVSKVLKQLEATGLVTRALNPGDKRSSNARLTSAGKAVAEQALSGVTEQNKAFVDQLPKLEDACAFLDEAFSIIAAQGDPDLS